MSNQKYEAFLKVAETGSFKEAARELDYTQAGVSYLVNALEKELGVPLLVREYGGARPTAEGADLLTYARDVVNAERRLAARLADLQHLEGGSVRVAAFTSTAIQWLPGMAKEFLRRHPAVDLDIACIDDQAKLEEAVRRGDFDCGFAVLPVKRGLEAVPLASDPMLIAVSPDHPLAAAKHFPAAALAAEPYIRLESGEDTEMDAVFRANAVEPHVRFSITSDYAAMSLVSAGLGFGVLPSLIVKDAPFPLVTMPPEVPVNREIALVLRSEATASAAARAFVEVAQEWVRKVAPRTR
ncbi:MULTISPECIES: LysR family transcriptional regulator [Gordonibacter]|uniref:LysR family transcriptional regulator n=1 Tax=Gordonibacter faecis TaxID=3047475 RepID=A0ABT7DMA3_9ACTN|nr:MULTISPECIES: LysR family transcriptional regulator [unclassified Gordonibacter]MDJ1649698.1 LysR family transcriptional regulator [Gordonibacter sp. KGMB12511]HIW76501.1 LysR family transcriptional regulator [Candidatus Gordonibacter avicola]